MDRATWQEAAHGGELAGMDLVAAGSYLEGGGWELYLDPADPARHPRLRTWPPHPAIRGMVSFGHFGSTDTMAVWTATSFSRDRTRAHRAFAVSAGEVTTRVVVSDTHGTQLSLDLAATHPDGRTQLFLGASTTLTSSYYTAAFDAAGQRLALEENPYPDRS